MTRPSKGDPVPAEKGDRDSEVGWRFGVKKVERRYLPASIDASARHQPRHPANSAPAGLEVAAREDDCRGRACPLPDGVNRRHSQGL
ncbi:hypothetical protein DF3PB_950009 [uncultured Defluviicoccus sp.]|uniref:Uncharacterized protein n=1 Tax=metagenome TaxID=256318 RepID=A0A380TME4_9ZZZZ|nr:hypothetical protein DF3PB_950009 [uncultured Defluviicoccus sp.]